MIQVLAEKINYYALKRQKIASLALTVLRGFCSIRLVIGEGVRGDGDESDD